MVFLIYNTNISEIDTEYNATQINDIEKQSNNIGLNVLNNTLKKDQFIINLILLIEQLLTILITLIIILILLLIALIIW